MLVDDDDYQVVSRHRWRAHDRIISSHIDGQTVTIGVFLLNPPPGMEVDHIDRDRFNNRRANLRLATRSQQMRNRRGWSQTGYKGVSFHRASGKYQAEIAANHRRRYLGLYPTAEQAARAYDAAARKLHGAFAYLNFPEESEADERQAA